MLLTCLPQTYNNLVWQHHHSAATSDTLSPLQRRLIAAAYDTDRKLLGSCCSLPINVLANNDAPNGPAFIDLNLPLEDSWEGWSSAAGAKLSDEQQLRDNSAESLQREHFPGGALESREPSSSFHAGEQLPCSPGLDVHRARSDACRRFSAAAV